MSDVTADPETRFALGQRAGWRCECVLTRCHGQGLLTGRCNAALRGDQWHAHRVNRSEGHTLGNMQALCIPCHENTPTFGRPLR